MIRLLQASRKCFIRFQSTVPKTKDPARPPAIPELQQAPNRADVWSKSQASRSSVLNHAKFVQKDLSKQPQPYAAIDLIAKEPIKFLNDRIATCQGNRSLDQGHPKVYINLDNPDRVGTCGYCGLRYAQEQYKAKFQE